MACSGGKAPADPVPTVGSPLIFRGSVATEFDMSDPDPWPFRWFSENDVCRINSYVSKRLGQGRRHASPGEGRGVRVEGDLP